MTNTNIDKDLENISKIISSELEAKKKEDKLRKLKEKAIHAQKDEERRKIITKEVELEEDPSQPKKVVQNIKLYEWSAVDRIDFKFDNKTFIIVVALSLILILFLAILGKFLLMGSLISLLFFIYVLGTTKPEKIVNRITARGIEFNDKLYEWKNFRNFYFTKRGKQHILIVETNLRFPASLILIVGKKDRLPIFLLMQEYVLYKEVKKFNRLEKMNYGEYIPLEEV